eukprot:gnl/TRDRNA2_/TRDRNA2_77943_c1_seq1.p1 gnl/TRDRNA2_/TRDRNA2_77943_c1~~gnl/TRDRNA2_/TRDRNA2_77943_c1_seq1.p1  ORF type:complete len:109 (+),score=13.53 gnl/TRDRNA2_/TRDRNA2_77943_c1_seq1:182-508(+)
MSFGSRCDRMSQCAGCLDRFAARLLRCSMGSSTFAEMYVCIDAGMSWISVLAIVLTVAQWHVSFHLAEHNDFKAKISFGASQALFGVLRNFPHRKLRIERVELLLPVL